MEAVFRFLMLRPAEETTVEAEVGAAALSRASSATTAAVEIGSQWSAASGFPILAGGGMAPVLLR